MSVTRLFRTVRHLRPAQVVQRVRPGWTRPRPRPSAMPALRCPAAAWTPPPPRAPRLLGPDRIRLLNLTADIADPQVWTDPKWAKLWRYNLHYFEDLNAVCSSTRTTWHARLLTRWIEENPLGVGDGWEPYPVSLRIVNWIKWGLSGAPLQPAWRASLALQARWLHGRIEWALSGNHLLANAKALVFAGLYFEGPEADRWLARGLAVLRRELPEQILADGGHYERSPMYQALVLEDLLDLINVGRAYAPGLAAMAEWRALAVRMQVWLAAMCHPDGEIGFFNDAAFGTALPLESLQAYAARLGLARPSPSAARLTRLEPSGYFRLALGEAVLIGDAAPLGPAHQPGHAHADTLSFELSLGQERVVVNGGVSEYEPGPQRRRERATAAHSTVEIAGLDSSEVWASFRVGRRARVLDVRAAEKAGAVSLTAAHDGYRHLDGRPVHRRSWRMAPGRLLVADRIEGGPAPAVARYHLAEHVRASIDPSGRSGRLQTWEGRILTWRSSVPAEIAPSEWRPEFGKRVAVQCLSIPFRGARAHLLLRW